MFESSQIPVWQDRIYNLQDNLITRKKKASRVFHYGKQFASKIDDYFQELLLKSASDLKTTISSFPLVSVAGWQYDLWENWDPATSKEDGYIRMGGMVHFGLVGSENSFTLSNSQDLENKLKSRGKWCLASQIE